MDKNQLLSKLNNAHPGVVLQTQRFGRSGDFSIWIEAASILKVARFLKNDSELQMDWLENLSIVEIDKALVMTYFVRSTSLKHQAILRASIVPTEPHEMVSASSVRNIWPMAEPQEQEAEEMFGVNFQYDLKSDSQESLRKLPDSWVGFPMRKSYSFPKEFMGIQHSRKAGSTTKKDSQ